MAAHAPVEEGETIAPSRLARPAVIALLIAAGFAVRATFEGDPGPLFLAPTLLAAYWYGRFGGLAVGVISTIVFGLAREVNPEMMEGTFLAAVGYRLVAYCAAGYAFGWLVEDRHKLRAEVDAGERQMAELRDLQEALAPPGVPSRPALELASCYVPAEGGAGAGLARGAGAPRCPSGAWGGRACAAGGWAGFYVVLLFLTFLFCSEIEC